MSQLQFPRKPKVGDIHERWRWDGSRWVNIPGTSSAMKDWVKAEVEKALKDRDEPA